MVTDMLVSFFNVAFDHETFYKFFDLRRKDPVVHNLFCNTDLLFELFSWIEVVLMLQVEWKILQAVIFLLC